MQFGGAAKRQPQGLKMKPSNLKPDLKARFKIKGIGFRVGRLLAQGCVSMRRWHHPTSRDLWVAAHPVPSELRGCCPRSHRNWAFSKTPTRCETSQAATQITSCSPAAGGPPGPPGPSTWPRASTRELRLKAFPSRRKSMYIV